jgi:4-aminobutyrate aminotransferase-like enzyme
MHEPTRVCSPHPGRVLTVNANRLVIEHDETPLEESIPTDSTFWSVWNGLVAAVEQGDALRPGDAIGVGTDFTVGLCTVSPSAAASMPAFVRPRDRGVCDELTVDPTAFLGLPIDDPTSDGPWMDVRAVVELRDERLARSQRSYYRTPMNLVRARGTTFVDDHAHHYLDAINNVTHVGHGHPHVVEAATRQMRRLNTNSRFVYEEMARYADRLADRLPDPLEVVFLVCTGSEANDLALRISRQVTGRDDVIVIDGAYHGNTTAVTGISPNRYKGSGGTGPPSTTHEVLQPNMYRGPYAKDERAGFRYACDVGKIVGELNAAGTPPAAFIAESLMGTAGQIVHPPGYLRDAFAHVRGAGGFCISDEVQVGFGRLGASFWGFELGGVVPDIVTMGKPMGNGHPIAALVTTREIADAFDTGMKYFNTFGGNPVSCAVAGAVLDVIDDERLQANAAEVGAIFTARLEELGKRHHQIGDVRGEGLYLGIELVHDRTTKAPATALTTEVCERMRERGVIVYPNGDLGNVLKIKPPMIFARRDVDRFVTQLDETLTDLAGGLA